MIGAALVYGVLGALSFIGGFMLLYCDAQTLVVGSSCVDQWSVSAALIGLTLLCVAGLKGALDAD